MKEFPIPSTQCMASFIWYYVHYYTYTAHSYSFVVVVVVVQLQKYSSSGNQASTPVLAHITMKHGKFFPFNSTIQQDFRTLQDLTSYVGIQRYLQEERHTWLRNSSNISFTKITNKYRQVSVIQLHACLKLKLSRLQFLFLGKTWHFCT